MVWLWILAVIALLITLLCWTRVGVWAAFVGGELRLNAKIGPLRIQIFPAKPKKAEKSRKEKPPKEKRPKKNNRGETGKKPGLSFALEDGRDAFRTLLPALKRALGRTRRGIRVKPLRLALVLGGQEDPAAAAQAYGEIQAAVWAGMPLLERFLNIRDPQIHTDVNFNVPDTVIEGETEVTFRIGTLLAVGAGMAFPALGWFLRWRKRCNTRLPTAEKPPFKDPPPKEPPMESPAA